MAILEAKFPGVSVVFLIFANKPTLSNLKDFTLTSFCLISHGLKPHFLSVVSQVPSKNGRWKSRSFWVRALELRLGFKIRWIFLRRCGGRWRFAEVAFHLLVTLCRPTNLSLDSLIFEKLNFYIRLNILHLQNLKPIKKNILTDYFVTWRSIRFADGFFSILI